MNINALAEFTTSTVSAAEATSTDTLVATPVTVHGIYIRDTASAGTVVLRDGGAEGTVKLPIDTPAAVGVLYIPIPLGGMAFATDVHATLTNVDGITIFYTD